jgi:hypothetical protein
MTGGPSVARRAAYERARQKRHPLAKIARGRAYGEEVNMTLQGLGEEPRPAWVTGDWEPPRATRRYVVSLISTASLA